MFQFPGLTHLAVWHTFSVPGCPIRKSGDIILVCSSPRLIAAYHVLRRLSEPRHPPYALKCFKRVITITRHLQLINIYSQYVKELPLKPLKERREFWSLTKSKFVADVKVTNLQTFMSHHLVWKNFFCGGYRSRTDDPLRARQMLWPTELIPRIMLTVGSRQFAVGSFSTLNH